MNTESHHAIPSERQLGRFVIGFELMEQYPAQVHLLLAKVLVLKADWRPDMDGIEYMGRSWMFDPIMKGMIAPMYDVIHYPDSLSLGKLF